MKNKSIFSLIVTSMLVTYLIVISMVFFILKARFNQDETILNTKLSDQINRTIIEKTTNYLLPAIMISEISGNLSENSVIDINNSQQLESYLKTQIKSYPQLSRIYLAKENGDFTMIYRNEKKSLSSKTIIQKTALETVKDYNLYEDAITTKTAKSSFDPRTRPWYYEAKEKETQIWTDLYMFYTGNRPGITASFPFYDQNTILQGVFGIDLELSAISEFLSLQKQYYESKILILNYKNEIVAQSGDIVFKTAEDGLVTPLHINQHSDNLIKQAYQQLLTLNEQDPKQSKQVKLVYQNELYLISAVNFPAFFGKNWKVMTILPTKQLLSNRVSSVTIFYIIIGLVTLGLIIMALILARSVSKPLKQLSFDMQRLQYKNIDGKQIKSSLSEINELIDIYTVIKKKYSQTFK